jgi:hypothetical protein
MVVVAVSEPEVPVKVNVYDPMPAEPLAVKVNIL